MNKKPHPQTGLLYSAHLPFWYWIVDDGDIFQPIGSGTTPAYQAKAPATNSQKPKNTRRKNLANSCSSIFSALRFIGLNTQVENGSCRIKGSFGDGGRFLLFLVFFFLPTFSCLRCGSFSSSLIKDDLPVRAFASLRHTYALTDHSYLANEDVTQFGSREPRGEVP